MRDRNSTSHKRIGFSCRSKKIGHECLQMRESIVIILIAISEAQRFEVNAVLRVAGIRWVGSMDIKTTGT